MRWRVLLASLAVVSVLTGAGALWLHRWLATALPTVRGVSVQAAFVDVRPVSVTITVGAYRLPWSTTAEAVRTDQTLWRRMHVADWNRVPTTLREAHSPFVRWPSGR